MIRKEGESLGCEAEEGEAKIGMRAEMRRRAEMRWKVGVWEAKWMEGRESAEIYGR